VKAVKDTICITTRYEYQARQVEHWLRKEFPLYKTEREGRNITTEAPSGTVRGVANACGIADDLRWIVVAA
jgi:hypothetical protein